MRWLLAIVMIVVFAGCGGEQPQWFPDNGGGGSGSAPNSFVFNPAIKTGVPTATLQTSNSVNITGNNASGWQVSVSGDSSSMFSINGGAFTNTTATILPNQTLAIQQMSSSNFNTTVTTTVKVGTYSTSFQSTTVAF
jgi:hypothetical protein